MHLGLDVLSAYADGELEPDQAHEARAHLDVCAPCATELAGLSRIDQALASPPLVECASSLELRSALLDGQLTAAEAAIADRHLADCATCASEHAAWRSAEDALRRLPAALPSSRVDAAMRQLVEAGHRQRVPAGIGAFIPGAGLRIGLAAALVLAIVAGVVPGLPGGGIPARQGEQEALVAAMVLYEPTNTFYVIKSEQAAVNAVDAVTYELRSVIAVGGRPTSLAVDGIAKRILVLDAATKSLIQIDPETNTVVASTQVPVTGVPTSVRVDPANGKIVVAAAIDPGQGNRGGPVPTPNGSTGEVAVLNGTTKRVEAIRTLEVAPRQVVTDPEGKGALFVSPSGTTFVDKTYQPQRTLPGGVSAAFGAAGRIAVLGGAGTEAVLHLIGDGAPGPRQLTGIPLAVTSLPDGGFAVLLGSGSGNGRIVVIDEAGAPVGITLVDHVGRDFTFDPATKRFAIVSSGGAIVSAGLPAGVVARPEQSDTPSATAPASTAPSASIAPAASAAPSSAPSPSPSPSPAPAGPSAEPAVPPSAVRVSDALYRIPLPDGRMPVLTTTSLSRIWSLDQRNALNALDVRSGAIHRVFQLPSDALIRSLAASETHVFALDSRIGRLYVFDLATESLVHSEETPPLKVATTLAVDGRGKIWIASGMTPELFSFDARTRRLEVVEVGLQVETLVADGNRGLWFSDGGTTLGFYDLATGRVTTSKVPTRGAARSLLPDPSGTVWIGTTAGEVAALSGGAFRMVATIGRPVTALALDPTGSVWFAAPSPADASRFYFAPAAEPARARPLPGPATGFAFNTAWRAWLVDPLGGYYLAVETPR